VYSEKNTSKVLHGFPEHIPYLWNVPSCCVQHASLGSNWLWVSKSKARWSSLQGSVGLGGINKAFSRFSILRSQDKRS
jgi:hypothetical protein